MYKKSMFIVTPDQFGYHSDDYYRAYYARNDYDVYVICNDLNRKKIDLTDVKIFYYNNQSKLSFNKYARNIINDINPSIVIIRYSLRMSLLKTRIKNKNIKWILDIRTGGVFNNKIKRIIYNTLIKIVSLFYKNITIISDSLAKRLRIKNYFHLPLGGQNFVDEHTIKEKSNRIDFLYVGIFDNRKIDVLLMSYTKFFDSSKNKENISLTIIGYAINKMEEEKIIKIITNHPNHNISFKGRIPNFELRKYFKSSNIGISIVPINPWYDVQPPTKTYEYLVNGLICLATNTTENKQIINSKNGVLINDTEEAILTGMKYIEKNIYNFSRHDILNESQKYTWENIYDNYLKKILNLIK